MPEGKPRLTVELLLAAAATFLSLGALVVTVIQTGIQRQQQWASVWPYLSLNSRRLDKEFALFVENKGVGPALIKDVTVTYQGRRYSTPTALLRPELTRFQGARFWSGIARGDVIKAGDRVDLFRIDGDSATADHLQAMIDEPAFAMTIVFGDVYGNCWSARVGSVETLPRCP
jgi:hypothetical protein